MKKGWKILLCLLVICAIGAVAVVIGLKKQVTAVDAQSTVTIQAGIGEEIEYGKLTAVKGNEITYLLAEKSGKVSNEEVTKLIPVGTDVTTKLGTVTTFSRLRAGDNVAIVRDKSSGEITAVYIIG